MRTAPLALALTAGMLVAVNPCGFALLPAYLSLLVLGDDPPGRTRVVARALVLTASMTAGFAAVFGVFGLVVAPVAGSVQQHLPWFTVGLGVLLAVGGGWLLTGRDLPTPRLGRRVGVDRRGPIGRSVPAMAAFGASYALASLGCTIGPFLAVVVASFRAGSVAPGILLFLAYAVGMGLAVGAAAVAVGLARTSLVRRVRSVGAVAHRIAGLILALVGAYVAYYGWYEIRVLRRASVDDPVVAAVEKAQQWASNGLDRVDAPTAAAVLLFLLLLAVLGPGIVGRRRRRHPSSRASSGDSESSASAGSRGSSSPRIR